MGKTAVHQVIGIEDSTLIVFHTEAHCWQFRLITSDSARFSGELYYTPEAGAAPCSSAIKAI